MSVTKDMWMDEVARVTDRFSLGLLDREEAKTKLCRLGFDPQEIQDMLDEAIA